jgi:hypothetical protein
MADITKEEKELLSKERLQSFRFYHIRTLAHIRKMLKAKRINELSKYLDVEIYNTTNIENKEFGLLLDAVTLKLKIADGKNDKTHSCP